MTAITPRQGGRYIRDRETGDVVKQDDADRSRIRSGTENSQKPKVPGPKAKDK